MDIAGDEAAYEVAEDGAQRGTGCVGREGIVLGLAGRKGGAEDADGGGDIGGGTEALQSAEEVEGDLVAEEGGDEGGEDDPRGAEDEDDALAVEVGDAAPEEKKAAEGEGVGGDDPLLARAGDGEIAADGGEDDDDGLDGYCLWED